MSKIRASYKSLALLFVFLICIIISFYIYASNDKNESTVEIQNVVEDNTTIPEEKNIIVAYLDVEDSNQIMEILSINELNRETYINNEGIEYYIDCTLTIPCLGLEYQVLSETSDNLLHHNLNKFWGPKPNTVGNYVIAGHNYNNKTYFGKLDQLDIGDIIQLTDINGRTIEYEVYDMYYVDPADVACTSQLTDGRKEVTLITCNATGSQRLVVKTTEIK